MPKFLFFPTFPFSFFQSFSRSFSFPHYFFFSFFSQHFSNPKSRENSEIFLRLFFSRALFFSCSQISLCPEVKAKSEFLKDPNSVLYSFFYFFYLSFSRIFKVHNSGRIFHMFLNSNILFEF